jgi:hypothetical protein
MAPISGGVSSIIIGLCLAYSTFLVVRAKNLTQKDFWYALFWFFGTLWWFFTGFGLLFWREYRWFAEILMLISWVWIGFHMLAGLFYLLSKLTKKILIHLIFGAILFPGLVYYLFFLVPKIKQVKGVPYIYYNVPGAIPHGYFLGGFIVLLVGFGFFILWQDFKKKKISLEDLSEFYSFYAIIFYGAISLPFVLYLQTGWILKIFYLLIPYLVYLGYVKRKKTN